MFSSLFFLFFYSVYVSGDVAYADVGGVFSGLSGDERWEVDRTRGY